MYSFTDQIFRLRPVILIQPFRVRTVLYEKGQIHLPASEINACLSPQVLQNTEPVGIEVAEMQPAPDAGILFPHPDKKFLPPQL